MRGRSRFPFAAVVLSVALAACAGPEPVLYANDRYQAAGAAQAEDDVAACRARAEAAGADEPDQLADGAARTATTGAYGAASGAVAGAIGGSPGRGALIGAAIGLTYGLIASVFAADTPSAAHVAFVERCLTERGYKVVGWE